MARQGRARRRRDERRRADGARGPVRIRTVDEQQDQRRVQRLVPRQTLVVHGDDMCGIAYGELGKAAGHDLVDVRAGDVQAKRDDLWNAIVRWLWRIRRWGTWWTGSAPM
jgi:hypothetical protein